MNTNSPVYNELNKAWKSTCKVIFGEEIGELRDYEKWLKEYVTVIGKRKSHISEKEVALASDEYCKDANFVSLDEVKEKSIDPLTINEIKDIDSIVEAISEKWEYVGNKILGNSPFVELSDAIINSQYVFNSTIVQNSSYVYASSMVTIDNKYIFGSLRTYTSEFLIRVMRTTALKRCFESHLATHSSDLYFCSNIENCSDLIFSFNQKSKRYLIGNLQLSREKYLSLKSKLIKEIREELKKNKKFPSLFELVPNEKPSSDLRISVQSKEAITDMAPIEKAFSSTFKVIFKKDVSDIKKYEPWLSKRFGLGKGASTPFGSKTYILPSRDYPIYNFFPERRAVTADEAIALGKLHLSENEITSLEKIKESLVKIGYFTDEYYAGRNLNLVKVLAAVNSANAYNIQGLDNSEYVAIVPLSGDVKYIFGCNVLYNSQFCLKCYYSTNLTRCFEMDASTNCSDTYFSHNCEGLNDAMFCFNAKAKRYAIGNSELPPDKYRKIKDMLVEQMADEIIKKKELKYDIFNVGCGKK